MIVKSLWITSFFLEMEYIFALHFCRIFFIWEYKYLVNKPSLNNVNNSTDVYWNITQLYYMKFINVFWMSTIYRLQFTATIISSIVLVCKSRSMLCHFLLCHMEFEILYWSYYLILVKMVFLLVTEFNRKSFNFFGAFQYPVLISSLFVLHFSNKTISNAEMFSTSKPLYSHVSKNSL